MKSMVCPAMKSMVWLIALFATVECRSRYKPHSKHLLQAQTEWPYFTDGSQWSHETTQKVATHPEAIIMNEDGVIDSKDNLGFEMNNPNKVAAGELYQSDMLLTDDQWAALRARKAIDNEDMRWTEGSDGNPMVPYVFQDAVDQDDVRAGLDHWMEHTCIKFEETSNTDQPHLQFHIGSGCWSNVGMLYWRDGQQISIGRGCNSVGTVVHEVGHAMGFFHEQSRSDRDSYVTVLWENLADNSQSVVNFGTENDNNYSVPYDYTSVMHYGKSYFSINNKPTIVTKDILDLHLLGRSDGLSHRDQLLANRMYNCIGKWLDECGLSSDPCINDGYMGKDCSCVCPPGTSGSNCAETVGDYYATSGCGGQFSSSTGTIRHPLNGGSYESNERCIWTINAAVPIKITFTSFDTENNYDYLYIRDGENTESPLAGNFTGDDVPSLVQIRTNEAYLLFLSDRSQTSTGFELQWEPSGIDPPTTESPTDPPTTQPPTTEVTDPPITQAPTTGFTDPSTTTTSGCGGEYTSSSGTIRHPLSGSSYDNDETCVWTIRTAVPIKITFISFYLEDNYDHLYLRDGNSIESTELGNLTGSSVPSPVQTNSNAAYILFTSDGSVTRTGFELQWETLENDPPTTQPPTEPPTTQLPTTEVTDPSTTPSGCSGESTSSSGTIRHPLSGSSYDNDETCVWTIRTAVPIKITFISFDLENNYDHLYLRDGNSIESTELGNFTGSDVPSPVQTNSNAAYILFTSDGSVTRTGFEIQWETLENDPPTTQPTTDPPTTQPPTTVVTDSSTTQDPTTDISDPSTTTSSVCGGECSFSSGTIRYPPGGDNYQNNKHCVWIIRTANPINITFISFSTEANYDFLYIRNGDSTESPLLGSFTGSTLPSPVQANSDAACLLFTSDHSVSSMGFEIQWEPIDI